MALPALFLLSAGCDDIETVINKSRFEPATYGNAVYYQGRHIGTLSDLSDEGNATCINILKVKKLWVDRTISTPGYTTTTYNAQTKQTTSVYHSGSYVTTHLKGYDLSNKEGSRIMSVFLLLVPRESPRGFVYLYSSGVLEESNAILNIGDDLQTNNYRMLWEDELVIHASAFAHHDAETAFGSKPMKDDEIFKQVSAATLEDQTVHETIIRIETGVRYTDMRAIVSNVVNEAAYQKMSLNIAPLITAYMQGDLTWNGIFIGGSVQGTPLNGAGSINQDSNTSSGDFSMTEKSMLILRAAAAIFGCEINTTSENYNLGRAIYERSLDWELATADNIVTEKRTLTMERQQIDMLYHPLWKDIPRLGGTERKIKVNDWYFGYRFQSTTLPQIIYRMREGTYNDIAAEALPQSVTMRTHMGGFGVNNFMTAEQPGFNLLWGMELFAGKSTSPVTTDSFTPVYSTTVFNAHNTSVEAYTFNCAGTFGFTYRISNGSQVSSLKFTGSLSEFFYYYTSVCRPDTKRLAIITITAAYAHKF